MKQQEVYISRILMPTVIITLMTCLPARTQTNPGVHDTIYACQNDIIPLTANGDFDLYEWNDEDSAPAFNTANINIFVNSDKYITVRKYSLSRTELIENGSFAMGNTGFTSDYRYVPGGTFEQGTYAILENPQDFNIGFIPCQDHSTTDDLMMVVDGSTVPGDKVWCQTVTVQPFTSYAFSTWTQNLVNGDPSLLRFTINDLPLGDTYSVSENSCDWLRFFQIWNSGSSSSAEICITNQNTQPLGNDLALDDISFLRVSDIQIDTFTILADVPTYTVIDSSICPDRFIKYEGLDLAPENSYTFNYQSVGGCDSTIVFNITSQDTIWSRSIIDSLCVGDTLYFNSLPVTRDTVICERYPLTNQCDSLSCLEIRYLAPSALSILKQLPACEGEKNGSLSAIIQAGLPPFSFLWNGSDIPDEQVADSAQFNLGAGHYTLQVVDARGCSAQREIQLDEPPPVSVSGVGIGPACRRGNDGQIKLTGLGGTPPYLFGLSKQDWISDDRISDLSSGRYKVYVSDQNGCTDSTNIPVPEGELLVVELPDSLKVDLGESLLLVSNQNSDSLSYFWTATDPLSCEMCPLPSLNPVQSQWIYLEITDVKGCTARDSTWLKVEKQYKVYLPNAFTPNGDGKNDFWAPLLGVGVKKVHSVRIYDRWGGTVFETEDCNSVCYWDGKNADGELPAGVYVYALVLEYKDGILEEKAGTITLIR